MFWITVVNLSLNPCAAMVMSIDNANFLAQKDPAFFSPSHILRTIKSIQFLKLTAVLLNWKTHFKQSFLVSIKYLPFLMLQKLWWPLYCNSYLTASFLSTKDNFWDLKYLVLSLENLFFELFSIFPFFAFFQVATKNVNKFAFPRKKQGTGGLLPRLSLSKKCHSIIQRQKAWGFWVGG